MTRIFIGWEEHEDLWIKAAIQLHCAERMEAFKDIASMSGRTEAQVRDRATRIRGDYRASIPMRRAA